ncbi:MAG: hypothetical protein ACLP59_19035 [Bryobacteraceae bacterium]
MPMPSATLQESDIDKAVKAAAKKLAPDVQWIRYDVTTDWSGDRAIFFRIMLSDEASRETRLAKITKRVEALLSEKLHLDDSDLLSYFSYRSRSEQAMLKESAWSKR